MQLNTRLNTRCGMLVAALASIGMAGLGLGTSVTARAQQPDTSAGASGSAGTSADTGSSAPHIHHSPSNVGTVAAARSPLLSATVHATHELHLTTDQQAQIKMILRNAQEQERVNNTVAKPDMTVLGDPTNPGYSAAIQALKTNAANRVQHESDLQTQVVNVLTPEQKAKLPSVLASLQAAHQAHRAAAAEHNAGGLR